MPPNDSASPPATSPDESAFSSPASPASSSDSAAAEPAEDEPLELLEPDQAPQAAGAGYVFDLDGGRLCLDFANTLSSSGEHLASYTDLVAFAAQSDLVTPAEASWLRTEAGRDPAAAQAVLSRARSFRAAVRAIFANLAADQTPADADLDALNAELAIGLSHACVVPAGDKTYAWAWRDRSSLDWLLWPVARSAAEVLVSDHDRPLIRECGASDCTWLFVDTSKNRSRQWCSMGTCGNREKARRHYQRVRATRAASA